MSGASEADMRRDFTVIVERDEDGFYVASVPALAGCHTQARSLDELVERVQEAIALCLEDADAAAIPSLEFIGVQRITVPA
jgi:predicted RNase H-like HicB family nuclease